MENKQIIMNVTETELEVITEALDHESNQENFDRAVVESIIGKVQLAAAVTPMHRIAITDCKGKVHGVHAAKLYSTEPGDWYLLIVVHAAMSTNMPFVVHTMNLQDGGFTNGAYFETLERALECFSKR